MQSTPCSTQLVTLEQPERHSFVLFALNFSKCMIYESVERAGTVEAQFGRKALKWLLYFPQCKGGQETCNSILFNTGKEIYRQVIVTGEEKELMKFDRVSQLSVPLVFIDDKFVPVKVTDTFYVDLWVCLLKGMAINS